MLSWLRRIIKPSWRRPYHYALAWLAAWRFGFPSRKLIIIGITGTDGKTTTATLTAAALAGARPNVGLSSTVWFQVGEKKWLNETHMTMPGRFAIQSLLRRMVDAGCRYAVLEVSSEGLAQGRLQGVDIDVAVLTNISPEHIESHGSFEKYRAAKKKLFTALTTSAKKNIGGQAVPKIAIVNGDDAEASFFLDSLANQRVATTLAAQPNVGADVQVMRTEHIQPDQNGSGFSVSGANYRVNLPGQYNVANALQAVAVAQLLGESAENIKTGLSSVASVPGRFEVIDAGHGRSVVIDYAVTPAAMHELYAAIRQRGAKRIIVVFGAAGGGRDHWKRPEIGKVASQFANHIILTSEDPFDEDPQAIAEAIEQGISDTVATEIIIDRRAAIQKALEIAQPGDVIALTGMGSETTMNVAGGKKVGWNDKRVVLEVLKS